MTVISLHTDMLSAAAAQAAPAGPSLGDPILGGTRFGSMVALAGRRVR